MRKTGVEPETGGALPRKADGPPTLSRVLREIESSEESLTLSGLSRELGMEPSALDGMLQLLVRKGRLREVHAGEECAACALRPACGDGRSDDAMGISYEVVSQDR